MATLAEAATPPRAVAQRRMRDARLDFFRGLGLLFIFLDHIPENPLASVTLQAIAFCDAADMFVFISGYSAGLVFIGIALRGGDAFGAAQTLRRCWTLYVAHIFLFVIFTAQVAYAVERLQNPLFADELGVTGFLREPHVAILYALILEFQPHYMNILPLYIVLLLAFALVLPLARRRIWLVLGVSGLVWLGVHLTNFNLRAYPDGVWAFNPFAWQALFFAGIAAAYLREVREVPFARPAWLMRAAWAVLISGIALKIVLVAALLPAGVAEWLWTLAEKTDLGPLRLIHFGALVLVATQVIRRRAAWLDGAVARPVVMCGRHSLNVFCFGIFLTVVAAAMTTEMEPWMQPQIVASVLGAAAMVGLARYLDWIKGRGRAPAEAG